MIALELRVRRWAWSVLGAAALGGLCLIAGDARFPLPISIRLISVPEVLALVGVVLATQPLLPWLPDFAHLGRERVLRPIRVAVSLVLLLMAVLPAVADLPHLSTFAFGLWCISVVMIACVSAPLAWLVPTIGGMAVFLADGAEDAPISGLLARPESHVVVYLCVLAVAILYSIRGPRAVDTAHG